MSHKTISQQLNKLILIGALLAGGSAIAETRQAGDFAAAKKDPAPFALSPELLGMFALLLSEVVFVVKLLPKEKLPSARDNALERS